MRPLNRPAVHYPRSPLVFVLAQVRISPVLAMESKIPAMQESLRKSGFPRLNVRDIEAIQHFPDGKYQIERNRQWEFINAGRTASVLVDQNFLIYQVTQYQLFEDFVETMRNALQVLEEFAEPGIMSRIGLRYVDLVTPAEGKSLEHYFAAGLRGFRLPGDVPRERFRAESISATDKNMMFIHRYLEATRGVGLPEDLQPLTLNPSRSLAMKSLFGLLDMDHVMDVDEPFSTEAAVRHLWALHHHQKIAFEASVTPEALAEWKEEK